MNFIYKLFSKFFWKSVNIDAIINQIDQKNIRRCLDQVSIGNNSNFYPEAEVENLTNDRTRIKIGNGTHIRGSLTVYPYGEYLSIGNDSYIGKWSIIRVGDKVTIGDNVLIAHNVTIIDSDSHEIDHLERSASFIELVTIGHPKLKGNVKTKPIVIGNFAWISYGVAILKGVTVGEGSIIGAQSVVTKDVPPWTVVAGNPAVVVKHLKKQI